MSKDSDLHEDLNKLIQFVSSIERIPDYNDIVIVEDDGTTIDEIADVRIPLKLDRLCPIENYQDKYNRKKQNRISWINLQCAGLYKRNLLIVIEYSKDSIASGPTSVNFSGPFKNIDTKTLEWDIEKKYRWH